MNFAREIKAERRRLRMSQVRLANILGVDVMTVSRWERAERDPRLAKVILMAVRTLKPIRLKKGGK